MPPSWKPQLPRWPSPTSPIEWCAITYAVPGSYGPAQVPITPLTASAPFTCGDSNQSSSRSAMLIVISRVTSAIVRTSRPRCRQASRSVSARSRGLREPSLRRHGEQQRAEHLGQAGQPGVPARHGVGVLLRPLGHLLVVALGVVGVQLDRAALGERLVVRAHREDLVAVPGQVEVVDDGRRHQAHHVGEPGHLELRRVRPGRLGGRRAAGLVACLQHQGARARTGPGTPPRPARCAPRRRRSRRMLRP